MTAQSMSTELVDQVAAINNKLWLADAAEAKTKNHRLEAGRMLLALRQQIESQGVKWWPWQQGKFSRSRKDIEKLMRLASAPNPEAALEKHKARVREEVKRSRERSLVGSNAADDESQGIVAKALALVARMTADERHEFMAELSGIDWVANPQRAEAMQTVN